MNEEKLFDIKGNEVKFYPVGKCKDLTGKKFHFF